MANQEPIKVTDDFRQCWQAAGRHLQHQVDGGMTWMRASLDEPFMEHLSFRLGNQLFFVRLEEANGEAQFPGTEADLAKIAEGCQGHACVMPMKFVFGNWIPAEKGWGLLSLKDRKPVNPPDLVTDEKIEMTDWELHDFAVQVIRQNLVHEGEYIAGWNNNPEMQPSIWVSTEEFPQWVVAKAVRWPEEASLPDNIKDIERAYAAKEARGNFAYVTFANAAQKVDEPLKEGEKPLPIYRGDKVYVSYSGLLSTDNN